MKLLIITVFTLLSMQLRAEDCSKEFVLDFKNASGEIPLYDQDFETCYAYSASQLIDYYRLQNHKKNDGEFSTNNPLFLAYMAEKKSLWPSLQRIFANKKYLHLGGSSVDAVDAAKRYGICLNSDINKNFDLKDSSQFLDAVSLYLYSKSQGSDTKLFEEKISASFTHSCNDKFKLGEIENLKIKVMDSKDFSEAVDSFFETACNNKIKVDLPKYISKTVERAKSVKEGLNSVFCSTNPRPAAISFCQNIFKNPSYVNNLPLRETSKNCKAHSVILQGKRFKNGKPEYLLRNVVGKDCSSYDKDTYECDENTGLVWVPEEKLQNSMYRISYFEK